ncbi:MAG: creatininase family protein [Anaerolineae bacterium]|jgi:creatinine amidohydrolase|nr:creatininase family protein [Anaerolineae bacterium]
MSDTEILYIQKRPPTLTEMTGAEVAAALKQTDVLLLPVGATENHGAPLPLGTDSMEAREICRRAALQLEQAGCPVVIGPVIPFGTSSFHMGFPGTVTLRSQTLISLIKEVCLSLYASGFRKYALIHGHDGSLPSMMVAAQEIVDETPDAQALVLNWLTPLSKVYHTIQTSKKGEGHGGEGETSRLLATHPELVHPELGVPHHLPPEVMAKIQGPEHIKTGGGVFYATRSYRAHTPYGYIGDPALASVATGEKGYAVIVDWITSVLRRDYFGR